MADEMGAVPPPYTSNDPLRLFASEDDVAVPRTNIGSLDSDHDGIPSYQSAMGEDHAFLFDSAAEYFDEHPAQQHPRLRHDMMCHTMKLNESSNAANISSLPRCWSRAPASVTQSDMSTFANYLFPNFSTPQVSTHEKLCEALYGPFETWAGYGDYLRTVVEQWNDGFFRPRNLLVELILWEGEEADASDCRLCTRARLAGFGEQPSTVSCSKARQGTKGPADLLLPAPLQSTPAPCYIDLGANNLAGHAEQRRKGPGYSGGGCKRRQEEGLRPPRRRCGQNSSSKLCLPNPAPSDLFGLENSLTNLDLTTTTNPEKLCATGTNATPALALRAIKSHIAAHPTLAQSLTRPQRLALKSELRLLKQDVKATAKQIKTAWREETRNGERKRLGCCQGKQELRNWKRESMGEIRSVAREVKWARRGGDGNGNGDRDDGRGGAIG